MENLGEVLWQLLRVAWLLPLVSFTVIVLAGRRLGREGVLAGHLATGAIAGGCALSFLALFFWLASAGIPAAPDDHGGHHAAAGEHADDHATEDESSADGGEHADHAATERPLYFAGTWYTLAEIGSLELSIGYHIDALTIAMFCMVTLIATCIHFYAMGYMHEELDGVTDHEVTLGGGEHLRRRGRYHRFFQYMSLFCFSMLGLVIAGNLAMVFVFWELVGICSYFLIGFYIERRSATVAGNKAFIVNRIGDFGMLIGMMALWASLGTFTFAGSDENGDGQIAGAERGIFDILRDEENQFALATPEEMIVSDARAKEALSVAGAEGGATEEQLAAWREEDYGYTLLVIGGLGIFCGCVGKSAQFPLHVWLPDAMEGPTPVSALVHSATMVAAGVYLVGRFYPAFPPEVLTVIAVVGAITLFLAATIAITATDIKRVLAYSTVSQLGYMMLALGVGGWLAGMFHLFTHAFFKSLLFLCSGSVIHAVHSNEMTDMGGLRKKMPYTAWTMLVGCLAIAGAGIPFVIGLSGYYSKDMILMQAMWFAGERPIAGWVFYVAAGGAAITAFYMFRLWYMTFAGEPRDRHRYEHAHESPKVMYVPLLVLAALAVCVAWPVPFMGLSLAGMLASAQWPATEAASVLAVAAAADVHDYHVAATLIAFGTALGGFLLATVIYGLRKLNAEDARRRFAPAHRFLLNKWYFDELYEATFVRFTFFVSRLVADFDKKIIDGFIDRLAIWTRWTARVDDFIDRTFVDGLVNLLAGWTYGAGRSLRRVQTGKLHHYVMFIVLATVVLFVVISFWASLGPAGVRQPPPLPETPVETAANPT